MRIDPTGKIIISPYEAELTKEERIEHEHTELIRILRPVLLEDPIEYEKMIRAFEHHDIIAARYRLYALTRAGFFPDSSEKMEEICYLQKYIGEFEIDMVDWPDGPIDCSFDEFDSDEDEPYEGDDPLWSDD